MDLRRFVEVGFATAGDVKGGSAERQDPRWLAAQQQEWLLRKMRELLVEANKADADQNLSEAGKASRRRELGESLLGELAAEPGQRLLTLLREKQGQARAALARAEQPPGESDIDRLIRIIQVQNVQQLLLRLGSQELRNEFNRALREEDRGVVEAVLALPRFALLARGILPEVVETARKAWAQAAHPVEFGAAEQADQALEVAEESLRQATEKVREFAGLPKPNAIKFLSDD